MPDGEGNCVLARFRSHSLTKDVPVIVLTASDNPGTSYHDIIPDRAIWFQLR